MIKFSIYKPTPELLEEIRCLYPPSYRCENKDIVILSCHDILNHPFIKIYTLIINDKHTRISFTVTADDAQIIHICKRRYIHD